MKVHHRPVDHRRAEHLEHLGKARGFLLDSVWGRGCVGVGVFQTLAPSLKGRRGFLAFGLR